MQKKHLKLAKNYYFCSLVYTSQDYALTQKICARSHDRITMTFRSSVDGNQGWPQSSQCKFWRIFLHRNGIQTWKLPSKRCHKPEQSRRQRNKTRKKAKIASDNPKNYQLVMKICKDISERAKTKADVVMLRKYVTMLFKEAKVTSNMRRRSLNGLNSWTFFLDAYQN